MEDTPKSSARLRPVAPTTVSAEIARQLQDLMAAGELRPGERLPSERELALRFDVGRPAVREALRELKTRGLLVTKRGRAGTLVADRTGFPLSSFGGESPLPTVDSITGLMTYRRAVESEAAAEAARSANLEDLRVLSRAIGHGGGPLLSPEDSLFHNAVGHASHNVYLQQAIAECTRLQHEQAQAVFSAIYSEPAGSATLRGQHAAVYEAIRRGDEAGARGAMLAHVDYSARILAQLMGVRSAIRVVVADLDGTLLSGPRHMSDRTRSAIAEVRDAGIRVVLASARPPRSMRRYHEMLGLSTPVIASNGALLWDLHAGIPLARLPVERGLATELTALGRSFSAIVNIESDDEWFADSINERISENLQRFGVVPPSKVGPVDEMLERDEPIDKVFLDLRDLSSTEQDAARRAVSRLVMGRGNLTETVPGLLDVVSLQASKAAMAQRYVRTLGVAADQVFAVGDHDNDVALLEWAGIGIAVGNATPAAKAAADAITSSNRRDGVAEALERWVLPREPGMSEGRGTSRA